MSQLIVGNWKMNGLREAGQALARGLAAAAPQLACQLVICPPFTLLASLAAELRGSAVAVGGQDCHAAPHGAFTGDTAAPMLADAGASHVIVGHSERRHYHGETNAEVRAKAEAAAKAGLIVIACVGETEAQRQSGHEMKVVAAQLAGSLPEDFNGIVAYEPLWAIGTGVTPSRDNIAAMHAHIRALLVARFGVAGTVLPLLYGGSVKASNAADLLAVPDVGGALVGGASLVLEEFLAIARAARG